MMRNSSNGSKLFRSFFLTYFIVLVIPVVSGLLYYQEAYRVVQRDIENENQALLLQVMSVLDARMKELESIGSQLINSTQVTTLRYLDAPLEYPYTQYTIQAGNSLPEYAVYNNFLFDYLIFYNKGQLAINNRSAYSYQDFYESYMRRIGQSYEEWLDENKNMPVSFGACSVLQVAYLRNGDSTEMGLVAFYYSFLPSADQDGRVALYVRTDSLLDLLPDENILQGGSAYIEDQNGLVLASVSSGSSTVSTIQEVLRSTAGVSRVNHEIDGQKMLISQITSELTGMRIVIALPTAHVFLRINNLFKVILISLALSMILGAVLCYILSQRNVSKMQGIVLNNSEKIKHMSYSEAVQSLHNAFEDIQMTNEAMLSALTQQKPYLQYAFLSRLLDDNFRSEEEAAAMARKLNILSDGGSMCVVRFRFLATGDSAAGGDTLSLQFAANCQAVIRLSIEEWEPDALFMDKSEEDSLMLLSGENLTQRVQALVKLIRSNLPQSINEMLFVYVGNTVNRLTDVVRSADNAATLIYIQPSPAEVPVLFFEVSEHARASLFYPQDIQHHLADCVMNGDDRGVINLLTQLKERNLGEACLPNFMRQLFIDSLLNTLLQIVSMSGLPNADAEEIYDKVKNLMGMRISAQLQEIDALYLALCQAVDRQKSGKQKNMIEGVTSYIESHYMDYDLSLLSVSDHFGVSESYLSYAFKLYSGINYFNFVEMVRMNKAKELLRETSMKISDIATQTGYASTNSFCRAFKRSTGDSATNYRNGID